MIQPDMSSPGGGGHAQVNKFSFLKITNLKITNLPMSALLAHDIYTRLNHNLSTVLTGQGKTIRQLLAAFAGGGHVLLEDLPGTGKTTLAKAFARSLDLRFQRIQFTPDLLPADIIGVSIYEQGAFHFHHGPLFTDILLADEINRASPRTQSALLEAMGEGQVSIDGQRHDLGAFFFVMATQNPIEMHGTYPLPEAEMDRFALRLSMGYLAPEDEVAILTAQQQAHPLEGLRPCIDHEGVLTLRQAARAVRIGTEVKRYIVDLVAATRHATGIQMGASPRASLTLMKTSQALALLDGLAFVTPELVQELAVAVIAHRLKLDPQTRFSGRTEVAVVEEILSKVPVPV